MPDILLVTTSERVKGLFRSLERSGGVRIRTAASLPLAEMGLSLSTPDCTFVHGNVSGYPLDMMIQHMKTILPGDANLAVLADDPEEMARAARHGVTVFDLTLDERMLKAAITDLLRDVANGSTARTIEVKANQQLPQEDPNLNVLNIAANAEIYAALRLQSYGRSDNDPVAEAPERPAPENETGSSRILHEEISVNSHQERLSGHLTLRDLLQQSEWAENIEGADRDLRRRKRRRFALGASALLVVAALSSFYFHGDFLSKGAAAYTAARQPAVPVERALPKPQHELAAKMEQNRQGATAKRGVPSLLPLLAGCTLDPEFSKANPGWERYMGRDYEYRLFKEAGLYRAIKVVPLTDVVVPEQFLKRVLMEFSGEDTYHLTARKKNGKHFIERGKTDTGVSVSIYSGRHDYLTKFFVIYYM